MSTRTDTAKAYRLTSADIEIIERLKERYAVGETQLIRMLLRMVDNDDTGPQKLDNMLKAYQIPPEKRQALVVSVFGKAGVALVEAQRNEER